MIEATSCGGVVIFRGKILLLYKNYKNKYEGWVLPKGTVEQGEDYKETAAREVLEETGVSAAIIKYIGKSQYTFNVPEDTVEKEVHWYLMMADNYYSKPQWEEYFVDSGYYKFHEAYHLLKFSNEKQILEQAYNEYLSLKKSNLWGSKNISKGFLSMRNTAAYLQPVIAIRYVQKDCVFSGPFVKK
ncbi:RNA pyrophosphohydrolase [Eubacterium plexicaudatum ASF492]|nr:RNA pyrophosphohydrolase [Eubacterium plexicaudatum ASF492]